MMRLLFNTLADVAPPNGVIAGLAVLVVAALLGLVFLIRHFIKSKSKKG